MKKPIWFFLLVGLVPILLLLLIGMGVHYQGQVDKLVKDKEKIEKELTTRLA